MSHASLSSPEEIIGEARNERMFLVVDDGDRENEGDLFVPAPMATPDAIDFTARHGRGLICLEMAKARGTKLLSSPRSRHAWGRRPAFRPLHSHL